MPVLLAILALSWPVMCTSGMRASARLSCLRVLSRSPENSAVRGLFDGCPASGAHPEPMTSSRKALMMILAAKTIYIKFLTATCHRRAGMEKEERDQLLIYGYDTRICQEGGLRKVMLEPGSGASDGGGFIRYNHASASIRELSWSDAHILDYTVEFLG